MTNIRILPQPVVSEDKAAGSSQAQQGMGPLAGRPNFALPPTETEPLGAGLEEIRADLMRHGERLAGLLADPAATFIRDAMRVLENQVCRIAVIGQVKGGQSAFLGALVGQPDLFPEEVSPWTTAVARLHFGWAGAPQGVAAEFQLFEAGDWERLASGTAQVRELTGQSLPGFEPELLGRHIAAMHRRTEERLGGEYRSLLGNRITHETLSREIVARHFAPSPSAARTSDGPGHLADITRAADLYFPRGTFGFPVTIIATPGIDDPFLVRDEITRQAVEAGDVHILVVNARQPLTAAELGILRLLRGLKKERIVVFIDHVDELQDPASEVRDVVSKVHQTLASELPAVEIPVIAGSARWARQHLARESEEARQALTPPLLSYARHKAALRPLEIKAGEASFAADGVTTSQLARALAVCSGYPELRRTLSGLLLRSHCAQLIRQIAAYFAELAQINETVAREEMVKHAIAAESTAETAAAADRELQSAQAELGRIQALAAELERRLTGLQDLMSEVVSASRTRLYEGLANILEDFARREGDILLLAFEQRRARRIWRCETAALRQRAEAEIRSTGEAAEERLARSEHNVFPALREAMLRQLPDIGARLEPAIWRDAAGTADLARVALADEMSFDLGRRSLLGGWARGLSPTEHASALERRIVRELMPVIDEAIRAATGELQRRAATISERATAISVAVIEALRKQSANLIARAGELLDEREGRLAEEATQSARLAALRDQLAVAEALSRRLADLNVRCTDMIA